MLLFLAILALAHTEAVVVPASSSVIVDTRSCYGDTSIKGTFNSSNGVVDMIFTTRDRCAILASGGSYDGGQDYIIPKSKSGIANGHFNYLSLTTCCLMFYSHNLIESTYVTYDFEIQTTLWPLIVLPMLPIIGLSLMTMVIYRACKWYRHRRNVIIARGPNPDVAHVQLVDV